MTVRWNAQPSLRRPTLVAAFSGWNDAADAASDGVRWLARTVGARVFATLDTEEYLDFPAARPTVLLGDVPHSRPMRCTGSATDEVLAAKLGMERSRYEGPTGIVGVLHDAARRVGFASASIWAPVPHYVATAPNPKATRALLSRLSTLIDIELDLSDLDIAASAWERSVDEVVAGDADASSYVERL